MDAEDLKLLNEIALIDQHLQIRTSDYQIEECIIEKKDSSSSQVDIQTTKELNYTCQRILKEIENQLSKALANNLEKQNIMINYLNNSNKKTEVTEDTKQVHLIKCAGIPYFKDFHGYPQPRNDDVRERLSKGELLSVDYLINSCVWNKRDKERLTKSVMNELETKKSENRIDWMKISATDMNGKYSSSECESQWKLHLSPHVNKQKWTHNEIEKLNSLAQKFSYQDWDNIAIELNTKRSGYQCCIQYQMKNSLNGGRWTLNEDNNLRSLVERFRKKNHIPWTKISWFFQTRSRKQCHDRYVEHLRDDLKKGLFSPAEDKIIISGVKIFKDFGKLAKFLPGRAPTQVRSRYYYLIGTKMSEFTDDEDKLLLSLVKKYSKDWLSISQNFPNRSKLQCRKRYAALCRDNNSLNGNGEKQNQNEFELNLNQMMKKEKSKRKGKRKNGEINENRSIYNDIVNYHENCSEYYFGPRIKNPSTEDDLKMAALKLRTTMAMLSISCDFSEKTDYIESIKNDCNFDIYDVKLLNRLAAEDALTKNTLKDNYFLHGMLIPPNRITLTGYHRISSTKARIKLNTCEVEGIPLTPTRNDENKSLNEKLSFSRAKALFKSRMKSIFLLSLMTSRIPTNDLSHEIYHKGKGKKKRKLTKKWYKNHAKLMYDASLEKKRKLKEATVTPDDVAGENGTT